MPSQVMRPTLHQYLVQVDKKIRYALRKVVQDTALEAKSYFEDTTRTWTHKVTFQNQMKVSSTLIESTVKVVGANKQLWIWTDKGTKPHIIRPKNAANLTFRTGYSARTQAPAGIGGRPRINVGSGTASGSWISTKQVNHPGTKPREFAKYFEKQMKPTLERRVQNAVRSAAQ